MPANEHVTITLHRCNGRRCGYMSIGCWMPEPCPVCGSTSYKAIRYVHPDQLEGAVGRAERLAGHLLAISSGCPEPRERARRALEEDHRRITGGQSSPAETFEQSSGGETIEEAQARMLRGEHAFGPHPGTDGYRGEET